MGRVRIEVLECDECHHVWIPEGDTDPKRCPKRSCRKTTWNHLAIEAAAGKQKVIEVVAPPLAARPRCRRCGSDLSSTQKGLVCINSRCERFGLGS